MKRFAAAFCFLVFLFTSSFAAAQNEQQDLHWQESPVYGSWSLNIGYMFFSAEDYGDVYSNDGMVFYNMNLGYKLIHELELIGSIGYGFDEGRGISPRSKEKTHEWYKLHIAPGALGFVYRFNFYLDQPLVPYLGASGVMSYWMEERMESSWERKSYNYGAFGVAGLMLLLDNLEKRASSTIESNWGINNSYLFYEYRYTSLNNLGDEEIIDLSSHFHSLGLMFEF